MKTKQNKKILPFIMAVLLMVTAFTVASQPAAVRSAEKDTLIVVNAINPITMDPYGSSMNNKIVTGQMFDSLLTYDENGEFAPCLAESWEESEDGKYITYKLRQDVKFHDGSPFNADCVVYSVDRMLGSTEMGWSSSYVQKAEKVDEYTVNIYKASAFSALNKYLIQYLYVISPTAYEAADPAYNPIGTGPYIFDKWGDDDYIYLKANKDYFRGAPYFENLIIRTPLDASTAVVALQNGEVDCVISMDLAQAGLLEGDPNITTHMSEGWSAQTIIMMGEDYMYDQNLRKAIYYGVNRVNAAEFNNLPEGYKISENILAERLMAEYAGFMDIGGYDFAKAQEYLAASDYDGRDLPIVIEDNQINLAQSVQADLGALGINTQIHTMDANSYSAAFVGGNSGLYFCDWGANYSAVEDQMTYHAGHGFYGKFLYNTPEFDKLLTDAGEIYTAAGRADLIKEALTQIWDFANMVPLYESMFMYAHNAGLDGFKPIWAANFSFNFFEVKPIG